MRNLALVTLAWISILFVGLPVMIGRAVIKWFDPTDAGRYLYEVALSLDHTGCKILYGVWGHTVSAETYRRAITTQTRRYSYFVDFINWLFKDPLHCQHAWEKEFHSN